MMYLNWIMLACSLATVILALSSGKGAPRGLVVVGLALSGIAVVRLSGNAGTPVGLALTLSASAVCCVALWSVVRSVRASAPR